MPLDPLNGGHSLSNHFTLYFHLVVSGFLSVRFNDFGVRLLSTVAVLRILVFFSGIL